MRLPPSVAPLLALLAACNLDAPQQYLVPDLRTVAIRASAAGGPSADADITEPVELEALALNPLGRTGVTFEWFGCLPAIPGQRSPCEEPDLLIHPQALRDRAALDPLEGPFAIGTGNPVTLDLDAVREGVLSTATPGLIALATSAPRLQCEAYFSLPIVVVVTDDSGEIEEAALKYVRIVPAAARAAFPEVYNLNFNPSIAALVTNPSPADTCASGTPLPSPLPASPVTICAQPASGSIQPYRSACQDDGSYVDATEDLEWQWYLSAGTISEAGFDGNATANPIELTAPVGPFTLWTIVRDGRGGTGWLRSDLLGP